MKTTRATPPQRIVRDASVARTVRLTTYRSLRAAWARPVSWIAAQTCATTATSRVRLKIHRKPECGRIGMNIVRRWCAYSSKAAWPANSLRLPYM